MLRSRSLKNLAASPIEVLGTSLNFAQQLANNLRLTFKTITHHERGWWFPSQNY